MNRRTALYILGGVVGVSILGISGKSYIHSINRATTNNGATKSARCAATPIVDYIKENQPKIHDMFSLKIRKKNVDNFNHDTVLKELDNLEFVNVDGFLLSYSEVEESYVLNELERQKCL